MGKSGKNSSTGTRPVIIGFDAISPLGLDLDEQWQSALAGESGIGSLTRFQSPEDFPVKIAGEVAAIDHLPYPFLKPREQVKWTSPIFKYALLTVHRALENSGLEITPAIAPRVAVTYSSAIGGLDTILAADRRLMTEGKLPHPFANPNACINMVGGKVSIYAGATGPISATITACATGLTSMIVGAMLIAHDKADVVICGAVDFALVEPIVAGFATMNGTYLPKEGDPHGPPEAASRPFSAHRRGFVISEGAGCLLLASREFAAAHGLAADVEMAGWSMTSDAYHFVAPNLETVQRCISESIAAAGVAPTDIDAVNAHAASTRIGDKIEHDALLDVFGNRIPPLTANKSLIGHAMGASSAIETIYTMKGMQTGVLPPTRNYRPDPEFNLDGVSDRHVRCEQEYVLKNAFGFGGCNSCAVFKRIA
ncbi:MAG: beta-ketoacyl-[acyl-carrier-protein] synthase family protein [Desulfobacterales bacterium]|nr:beta-ketoacyl-[acyl-carrier-protein] synthase family protein [Desulfobacterales bacterium]